MGLFLLPWAGAADAPGADSASTTAERLGFHYEPPAPPRPAAPGRPEALEMSPGPRLDGSDLPVVALPPLVVTGKRSRLTEEAARTDAQTLDLAKKRFLSPVYRSVFGPLSQLGGYYLNFLSLMDGWHPNDAEAMTLYRQEQRLRMLSDLDDLLLLEQPADPKAAAELRAVRLDLEIDSR